MSKRSELKARGERVPSGLSLRAGESIGSLLAGEGALDDHVLQGRHVNVGVEA